MTIKHLVFSIILFSSCNRPGAKNTEISVRPDSDKIDSTVLTTECIQRDTITQMGTRIHYFYAKGKFTFTWGDTSYSRVYDSSYSCSYDKSIGLWDFVPKLKFETKSTLVLTNILETSSGGNPAPLDFYAIVLPKNKEDTAFEKELFIACEGEYLIYGDWHNDTVHILNLETKKSQNIILTPIPDISRSPTMSIKNIKISGSFFFIEYEALGKNDNLKIVSKKFELTI
jgi:hypothetical protein